MSRLTVNDRAVEIRLDPQTPLLWGLRDAVNLTGTKYGCGSGDCGERVALHSSQPVARLRRDGGSYGPCR